MRLCSICCQKTFVYQEKIFITSGFIVTSCSYSIFFLLSTGKISSIMVKIGERKLPLVIQCFLLIILLKQSITVERYPVIFFYAL
jgi:hypothetical protein